MTAQIKQRLWLHNIGLVQLLGLCPLLAVSHSLVTAASLGLATIVVLVISNVTVSALRHWIANEVRIPVFMLVIASAVTAVELLCQALAYPIYLALGIFLPLIVTNCAILSRAEVFASSHSVGESLIDGLLHGVGFLLVLLVLGGLREVLGRGTLGIGADRLLGPQVADWYWRLLPADYQFLPAILPVGAFIGLGLLLAAQQAIVARDARRQQEALAL